MVPYLALFCWPAVAAWLFSRYSAAFAAVITVTAGYLLLPERTGVDLPVLPEINKETIATGMAVLLIAAGWGKRDSVILKGWLPGDPVFRAIIFILPVSAMLTTLTNSDPLVFSRLTIPAMRIYDGLSLTLTFIMMLLPFLIGRKMLAHPDQHRMLLIILCIATVLYAALALYEVRMSPQLNRTVYGFFPHSWQQHFRAGGWRPLVFLKHGLFLGIFMCCALIGTIILFRTEKAVHKPKLILAGLWIFGTLFLAKVFGSFLIALVFIPIALFLNVRLQMLAALSAALIIMSYPVLRGAGLVPVNEIVSTVEQINPTRADSLAYRIDHENRLLAHANERPLFGWGLWARNRDRDPETGFDRSTTDGFWVILIGTYGWTGYLSIFGLLVLPIVMLWRRQQAYGLTLVTSGLCLMMAANVIDLIPNSGVSPVTWMIAGALAGRLELGRLSEKTPQPQPADPAQRPRRRPGPDRQRPAGTIYTRQKPADRKVRAGHRKHS